LVKGKNIDLKINVRERSFINDLVNKDYRQNEDFQTVVRDDKRRCYSKRQNGVRKSSEKEMQKRQNVNSSSVDKDFRSSKSNDGKDGIQISRLNKNWRNRDKVKARTRHKDRLAGTRLGQITIQGTSNIWTIFLLSNTVNA
jgi:hypothetical protein